MWPWPLTSPTPLIIPDQQDEARRHPLRSGPVIARGPNINPFVFERLVAAAEAEGIPYQLEAEPAATGTDARAIQISKGGVPTGLVSIPLRYMHTPNETVSLKDIDATIRLLVRFALDLEYDASFVPGISAQVERPNADRSEKKPVILRKPSRRCRPSWRSSTPASRS